jgi:nucleotide-binding universal stress UspA family protein
MNGIDPRPRIVARELLSSCAVVNAHFQEIAMAPRLNCILVPTDFSETADTALAYAKDLATRFGASLHLVHVFTDPYAVAAGAPEVYGPVSPDVRERAKEEVRERLLERLDASEESRFRGSRGIVRGLIAPQIVAYAASQDIDLIVMGTHGRRGVAHLRPPTSSGRTSRSGNEPDSD